MSLSQFPIEELSPLPRSWPSLDFGVASLFTHAAPKKPQALAVLENQGVSCGALHPIQSFASAEQGVASVVGSSFGIDGKAVALEAWEVAVRVASKAPSDSQYNRPSSLSRPAVVEERGDVEHVLARVPHIAYRRSARALRSCDPRPDSRHRSDRRRRKRPHWSAGAACRGGH